MPSLEEIDACFRIRPGAAVTLAGIDPRQKTLFTDRKAAEAGTEVDIREIDLFQDRLYAEGRQALLVVLQAMDAGGKDGTIRRVFGPVDPLGLHAYSFKKPTPEELAHDFLWRVHDKTPGKGEIAVFNRSHYEDVLVVRVKGLVPAAEIERRYDHIKAFERLLSDSGTRIVKLFLHISPDEQRKRLQERVDVPQKRWKFNPGDLEERKLWTQYREAYEIALGRTSTERAPWYVIPADRNWYRNALVARIVRLTLEAMDPRYPEPAFDHRAIKVT